MIRTSLSNISSQSSVSTSKYSVDRHTKSFIKSAADRLQTLKSKGQSLPMTKETLGPKFNQESNHRELILLCLDYLRSIRRNSSANLFTNNSTKDYMTIAIWALNQSIQLETQTLYMNRDNDPYYTNERDDEKKSSCKEEACIPFTRNIQIPSLSTMESEFLYKISGHYATHNPYEYDDHHPSNQLRYYRYEGLDNHPLSLPDFVSSTIKNLNANVMTRKTGEEIMKKDPMFLNFVEAVKVSLLNHALRIVLSSMY